MLRHAMLPEQSKWFPMSMRSWVIVLASLVAIVAITEITLPYNPIDAWYYKTFMGPQCEKTFGFTADTEDQGHGVWVKITSVTPGGPFDRAGVKAGMYHYTTMNCLSVHPVSLFYGGLSHASAKTITLKFVDTTDIARAKVTKAVIQVPKKEAGV